MKVNEIFGSIEGEGVRMGYLSTFIRLYGCNLNCSYCDTRYSCQGDEFTQMSLAQIGEKVAMLKNHRVTITGGEPLIHKDIDLLINLLLHNKFEINIETNGSVDINQEYLKNTIITMDYKSISSGENQQMIIENINHLKEKDVLKFVVSTKEDLQDMLFILKKYNIKSKIYISPVFGKIEMKDIVLFMQKHDLQDCIIQAQLHKIIWDPDMKGV